MTDEAPYRVGLRVGDVAEAASFYAGLGFDRVGEIPGPDGRTAMAFLRRGGLQLVVDALSGLPFADSRRERRTQAGPRGLGVVVGIEVEQVGATARYCGEAGCEVTVGPVEAPWGERYVECVDPYGYAWKFFQILPTQLNDGLEAARDSLFGAT